MKKQRFEFRTLLALILAMTIILLPFDTLALKGQAVTSENTATPDEMEPTRREKDDDPAQTGTVLLDGDGTEESPYIIATSDDWDALSESINSGSTEYSGKYFKMTDDISVSTMLGNRPDTSSDSNDNVFSGVFDGDGHELNVNLDDPIFAAPFAVAHNATIKNLHVTGTVKTGANHSTGLVAASKGKSIYDASYLIIQNVTVSTDVSCNSHIAGIVGHAHSADITMENVVFDGSLSASSVQGGMIGWGGLGNGAMFNASFKDCLFAGTYNTSAAFYPIAYANGQGTTTLVNDFYTTSLGSGGSPVPPTGDGQLKLLSAQVEKDGAVKYFDNINTAADGSNWVAGSTLKLMTDVTTSSTITVPSGEHTLDLNGHGVKMTGSDSVFTVRGGAKLIINDSNPDTEHRFSLSNAQSNGAGLATVNDSLTSGYQTFKGGYITGGKGNARSSWREGGAIYIEGEVEMNAGTLIGNGTYGSSHGGGFETRESGRFVMNGGSIQNNAGLCGGACRLVGGSAEFAGGKVINNVVSNDGGGIHVGGTIPLVLKDCEISGNYANGGPGAGVWMSNDGTTVSGKTVIKDNFVGTRQDNIEIPSNRVLYVGELTDGASIGITMQSGPAAFTSGWKDKMGEADPSKYFTSDDNNYQVFLNGNGEVEIGVPPVASVISGDVTTNYSTISDAVSAWTADSTLKLLTDVTTGSTIAVPTGEHTLDLNGHGIRMTGSGSVINVGNGATLNLDDSNTDTTHKFDVPKGAGLAVLNEANGNHTVSGGYITGGNANPYGGGVCVAVSGKFNMYGGTIIGNNAVSHGGGVSVSGNNQAASSVDNFKMYGGAVSYNTANWGGGIGIYGKTYLYEKSIISNNTANSGGGGIELENNGRLYMSGGTVTENAVLAQNGGMWKGGGIHLPNGSECHIQGNVLIKDNYQETYGSKQNNLFIRKEVSGKVILDGELTLTALIGVGTNGNTPFTVTAGYGAFHAATDPSKYFTSDDSNYAVILNNNGEAYIGLPPVASIVSGDVTTSYSAISDAVSAWTAGSTLKLLADVTASGTVTVPSGAHTLDLNGYDLKAGSTGYSVVTVGSGAELTIDDTSENVGKITGGSVGQNYGGGVTVDGGTLTLKGGAISGNANTHGGIGNCGGGVHVRNGGKFYMEGGEISGNTSYVGGGVCSDTSATTVSITGGVIKNNKTDRFGSAIWAGRSGSAVFRIGGDVQIIDNISTWTADKDGEASVNFVGELLLSGDPTVHGDWKTSGTSAPNSHINLDNDGSGVQRLTLEGALTNDTGTPSITMSPIYRWNDLKNGKTFVFTKNWSQYMGTAHPADYFKLDDSLSGVTVIRKNGEAEFTGSGDLGDLYITFDANGGEGEMDPQLATVTNVTLNENTFTRKGYSFAGWNTEKDGSGTAYADGANITLSGDLTLYAQWKEPVASIISGETTTSYSSLSDAVNAWTEGSTLKLLKDVSNDTTITVSAGEHILDLNGHTLLELSTVGKFMVGSGASSIADLTIIDSVGTGVIKHETSRPGSLIWIKEGSSLTLDGGTLEANSSASPVIDFFQQKNASFTMNGGKIIGTANNGAVRFGADCTFTMTGGEISGLQTSTGLFDYSVGSGGAINISGAPVVKNNTANGTVCNFNLPDGRLLNINSELTDGASVGIKMQNGTGVFTSGWKANMGDADPSKYFTSDDTAYVVVTDENGEAMISEPAITGVTATGFNGDYDGKAHSITVSAPSGTTIKYGTQEGSYTLTENPTYTDAGTYTVYYQVSKSGFLPFNGFETVKINKINAVVTITGHTLTTDYNGNAHSADGYDATASSALYDVNKNVTYNGRAEAVRTNAGTTYMGLTAEKFSNTNDNFANVTFYVTDGSVTIDPVDAVLTPAPHAKDQLVYNGSNQTLVEPGTVTGGTLCYALGSDERIAPSDSQYDQDVPVARDVGNYYIWYKVIADSNHNDLAPACVKVTLAEEGWTTVSGRIYDDNNNPVSNAIVSLTIGGKTVDQIISGSDGGYYFTAPPGLYNIVVKYDGATVTDMIDIDESTTYDVSIFDANTDSFLNIVGFDSNIVVGGLNKEAEAVRAREGVSSDKNVTVSMTVTPIAGGGTDAAAAIEEYASDRNVLYYDFEVEETVDMITTYLDRTQTVLEIAIPCSFVNKQELAVYTSDGSSVQTLIQSDTKAAGTFRVDTSAGLVYIYTDEITTYALGYKPYYSVTSDVSLGSYTGVVSVTLTKDGETIYELNDVSMDNISFRGVPKGTYSMTITWTDGAENTLTTPFEIQ